ncbi:MAG: hypothetical protein WA826_11090 [Silvibacterium sp.]
MPRDLKDPRGLRRLARAVIEIAFIVFLFYSNLLMGDYTASRHIRSLGVALRDIVTPTNFLIALCSALVGYVVFEFLRKKL